MSYYTVNVSSELLGQPAGAITVNMTPPLDLTKGVWLCSCQQASLWYTYYNVSASSYNNSSFSFNDGTSTYTATIPDGVYDAALLISSVYAAIAALTSTGVADDITIAISEATLGFSLFLAGGCTLDLSAGGSQMYLLFGAAAVNYTTQNTLIIFPQHPNITASTSVLSIKAPGLISSTSWSMLQEHPSGHMCSRAC